MRYTCIEMVQLIFSLRFQSQLRRTRPKLLRDLERSIIESIESFGGKVKIENKLVNAAFNRETIGFWLDMLCLLEKIKIILEKASSELFGHICIVGENISDADIPVLVRALPSNLWGTGIWCAPGISNPLNPFIDFDKALQGSKPVDGYSQMLAIRNLEDTAEIQTREKNNSEKIRAYLKQGTSRNTIIVGDERIGKLEGLYRYCEEQMKGFPPLLIRFREGVNAVACFIDALSPEIQKLLGGEEQKNLEHLSAVLFQERLREELSEFTIKRGERFFTLLLKAYREAVEKRSVKPMMIFENIQDADTTARQLIINSHFSNPAKERVKIYGTATKLKALESWEELFPRIIKFTPEKVKSHNKSNLPRDLRAMGYCCALLKRYFPPFLLPQLLQEEGKNPEMIEKTLSLLSHIQTLERIDFEEKPEETLGKDAERVRILVRRRLLSWVNAFRLKPCFQLLIALSDLGSPADDNLVLDSICADIINGTYSSIENAVENGTFSSIAGKDKSLLSIIKTQKALSFGNRQEILSAFGNSVSVGPGSPGIKARMFGNTASYHLSACDTNAAADSVKEAMLLSQNENSGRGLARIYRLFSLVEFSNQELSDAIDYFSFAMEHAEKAGDQTEFSISAYYAAAAHFIFGNISKAKNLAVESRKAALEALLPGWADRSRFLEGRIFFETGLYQEALDIFTELRKEHLGSGTKDFEQTVDAWMYRANTYLNSSVQNNEELKGTDALLFKTEAAFIRGDYQKTLTLVNKLEKTEPGERFVFIEQPDWRSGFYQCELLLFPMQDLLNRMIHTFKALALCHINSEGERKQKNKTQNETVQEMQRIIRNDLPETDPNNALYLYSYYQILKCTEAPEVDLNTAISLAFKRLQKRASRIDNNETKRTFLFTHYWNSALAAAAKEHKLI